MLYYCSRVEKLRVSPAISFLVCFVLLQTRRTKQTRKEMARETLDFSTRLQLGIICYTIVVWLRS